MKFSRNHLRPHATISQQSCQFDPWLAARTERGCRTTTAISVPSDSCILPNLSTKFAKYVKLIPNYDICLRIELVRNTVTEVEVYYLHNRLFEHLYSSRLWYQSAG